MLKPEASTIGRGTMLHIRADVQQELTRAFVRLQEFYEAPWSEIRGHYFTLEALKLKYCAAHGEPFSYYDDWHGFNIPGNVVREFFSRFDGTLSSGEQYIHRILDYCVPGWNSTTPPAFYLIGSHASDGDEDALDHEICHARFYLDGDYHHKAQRLVTEFTLLRPDLARLLLDWMLGRGYADTVLQDEVQAYLATTPQSWWEAKLGATHAPALWAYGAPFRLLAGMP